MNVVLVFWHWWTAAAALLLVELITGTFFFLSLTLSAVVTGTVVLLLPRLTIEQQVVVFSTGTICSLIGWLYARKRRRQLLHTDRPLLNRRAAQLVGRVVTLDHPIVNGEGRIQLFDTYWKAHGPDCPVGARVRVVGAEGVVLRVELVN